MSAIYQLRNFEQLKITIEDIKTVQGISIVEERKDCYGVKTSLYFIFKEFWKNKLVLEIGFSQGYVYGFIRYDNNHEEAISLISLLSEKLGFDYFEVQS